MTYTLSNLSVGVAFCYLFFILNNVIFNWWLINSFNTLLYICNIDGKLRIVTVTLSCIKKLCTIVGQFFLFARYTYWSGPWTETRQKTGTWSTFTVACDAFEVGCGLHNYLSWADRLLSLYTGLKSRTVPWSRGLCGTLGCYILLQSASTKHFKWGCTSHLLWIYSVPPWATFHRIPTIHDCDHTGHTSHYIVGNRSTVPSQHSRSSSPY